MDMGRTCVNLIGNCIATVVVARWEGEFDDTAPQSSGRPLKWSSILNPATSLSPKLCGKATSRSEFLL
jgi:hypothetical protein